MGPSNLKMGLSRVSQKKMGFVIVIILAPKIIFKVTLILLGISVPYIKFILSYCGGLCHEQFGFYGYFSFGGFSYFGLNDGILMRKLKCA